jgi:hypothetical protein
MRYKKLKYGGKEITNSKQIDNVLYKEELHWLIDCEIENADIEIEKKTLIWNSGNFITGNWLYGIFKDGTFHGTFENGIFENGNMRGNFISGIKH